MLNDKKYESLHSAVLEVVSKNEDVRQKEINERYGKYALQEKAQKYSNIVDVIGALDDMPKAKRFRVKGAEYDDVIYKMPEKDLKALIGLTYADLQKIEKQEDYAGFVSKSGNTVEIGGAA